MERFFRRIYHRIVADVFAVTLRVLVAAGESIRVHGWRGTGKIIWAAIRSRFNAFLRWTRDRRQID